MYTEKSVASIMKCQHNFVYSKKYLYPCLHYEKNSGQSLSLVYITHVYPSVYFASHSFFKNRIGSIYLQCYIFLKYTHFC